MRNTTILDILQLAIDFTASLFGQSSAVARILDPVDQAPSVDSRMFLSHGSPAFVVLTPRAPSSRLVNILPFVWKVFLTPVSDSTFAVDT